jgi:hypothetical protein
VHTTFSDGSHRVEEITARAKKEGIDVVVLTDHFFTRIEYGPPLFRKALAVSVRSSSLGPRDLAEYVAAVRRAEQQSGVMAIPGVEITPFYYWEGDPLSGDLTLNSAHRHLLVLFQDDPDLQSLSRVLHQMSAPGTQRFDLGSLLLVWPLLPAMWAFNRLRRQKRSLILWLVAAGSVGALARSWPYTVPRHSPYRGDAGAAPYQEALDVASPTSTLTFWAHPETSAHFQHSRYPVTYRSDKYAELIHRTRGATGFASVYEGYREGAAPGGSWDRTLKEFTDGRRTRPLWTVGELDLHREGEAGGKFLGEVETMIFAKERSHRAVIEALRDGSMYAVRQPGTSRLTLERFRAVCGHQEVEMGQRATVTGPCRIEAVLLSTGEALKGVTVSLVRNGEVAGQRSVDISEDGVELAWNEVGPPGEASFYRLIARRGNRLSLYSNPIFVTEGGRP